MKSLRACLISFLLMFLLPAGLFPDIKNGYIRLILHEKTGRFSLYYLSDTEKMRYTPLISSRDPRTSYLSIYVNGRVYRLGDSNTFKTSIERIDGDPAFVFTTSTLVVTQVFSPVKSGSAGFANGIMITVTVENTGKRKYTVGMRMLLDTELGEKIGSIPFITNQRLISGEVKIENDLSETFWLTRGENVALMGSVLNPVNQHSRVPDYIHIANWKRLNDAPWKLKFYKDRSFNNMPYSIRDSAVCYYYEPESLEAGNSFTYTVVLSTEDIEWYASVFPPVVKLTEQESEMAPASIPAAVEIIPATETPETVKTEIVTEPKSVTETKIAAEPKTVTETETVTETNIEKKILNLNIDALRREAIQEAAKIKGNANVILIYKMHDILDQFINGKIDLNEQDLNEIEAAFKKYSYRE